MGTIDNNRPNTTEAKTDVISSADYLSVAIRTGDWGAVLGAIVCGCDPNATVGDDHSPLAAVILGNRVDLLKPLFRLGVADDVNPRRSDGLAAAVQGLA